VLLAQALDGLADDDPAYATSLNNLATVLMHRGRFAEAEGIYRRSLEIRPDKATTLSNLGVG
jgi:Flp pilus assembly protein TadD